VTIIAFECAPRNLFYTHYYNAVPKRFHLEQDPLGRVLHEYLGKQRGDKLDSRVQRGGERYLSSPTHF
jgi:hypothetical protein